MATLELRPSDTALPYALEQYYTELLKIVGERSDQPLLLNNVITTFDINAKAPFYTEGVFRQFADRKFKQSPDDLGTAIQADRFSFEYERAIDIATAEIDEDLTPETRERITAYEREIKAVNREIVKFEIDIQQKWEAIAKAENLTPNTREYQLRNINFLESILYADQKKTYTDDIQTLNRKVETLRNAAYTPAQRKLLRAKSELAETYKIARPWNAYFERDFPEATVFTFADPKLRSVQLCDVSPSTYPSADLVTFQQSGTGTQTVEISETTVHNETHDSTWGASGSASFKVFGINVGGGGGGSSESHYRRAFKSLKSFSLSFAGITEVYANRGLWFDPSLLTSVELKPIFDTIPGARDLELVAVSLVIARGLTIKVEFKDELEVENWSKKVINGRGGASFMGVRFGGSAGSTSYDYDLQMSEDKKSVTFIDDPKHCRLLAVRLERIFHPVSVNEPEVHARFGPAANVAFNEGLAAGRMALRDFQLLKTNGFPEEEMKRLLSIGEKKDE